jgi:hypothetical protein
MLRDLQPIREDPPLDQLRRLSHYKPESAASCKKVSPAEAGLYRGDAGLPHHSMRSRATGSGLRDFGDARIRLHRPGDIGFTAGYEFLTERGNGHSLRDLDLDCLALQGSGRGRVSGRLRCLINNGLRIELGGSELRVAEHVEFLRDRHIHDIGRRRT